MAFAIRNPWDRLPGAAFIQGIVQRYSAPGSALWTVTATHTATGSPATLASGWSYLAFFRLGATAATSFPTALYQPRATTTLYYAEDIDLPIFAGSYNWTGEDRPPPNSWSWTANTGVVTPPAVTSLPTNSATSWTAAQFFRASGQTSSATARWSVGLASGAYASQGPLAAGILSGWVAPTSGSVTEVHITTAMLIGSKQWDEQFFGASQIRRTPTEASYAFSDFGMQMVAKQGNLVVLHWHHDGELRRARHEKLATGGARQWATGGLGSATAKDPGFSDGEVIRIYAT